MENQYKSASRRAFELANYSFFVLLSLSIVIPFLHVIAISLSTVEAVAKGEVGIWPAGFNVSAYASIIGNGQFLRTVLNTVGLTIVNTMLVIVISLCGAYALSSKHFIGKEATFIYILITMFFNGGIIPTYLLINKIGINNSYWALILPVIVNAFYLIVFKNVISQLPVELLEAAEMDGAGEYRTLFRIVLPLVLPMTMAFTIFSAVAYWNEWFGVLLYIRDKTKWTLQFQLRDILINAALLNESTERNMIRDSTVRKFHPENLKMAAVMITIIPIVIVYPFLQKYFIHGVLVGAVKG